MLTVFLTKETRLVPSSLHDINLLESVYRHIKLQLQLLSNRSSNLSAHARLLYTKARYVCMTSDYNYNFKFVPRPPHHLFSLAVPFAILILFSALKIERRFG